MGAPHAPISGEGAPEPIGSPHPDHSRSPVALAPPGPLREPTSPLRDEIRRRQLPTDSCLKNSDIGCGGIHRSFLIRRILQKTKPIGSAEYDRSTCFAVLKKC